MSALKPMTEITEHRAIVSWAGAAEPIVLTVYDTGGEVVAVPLSPVRALELAKELSEPAVMATKVKPMGPGWPG